MQKKMLVGGLVTKNIIKAFKEYIKSGGNKTSQIVKDSGVSRDIAKKDIKSELRRNLKSKRSLTKIDRQLTSDINKLR